MRTRKRPLVASNGRKRRSETRGSKVSSQPLSRTQKLGPRRSLRHASSSMHAQLDSNKENSPPGHRQRRDISMSTERGESPTSDLPSDAGDHNDEPTFSVVTEAYWRKKGMILGRCVEMWETFAQIINEGVSRNPDVDEDHMHTDLENQQYRKFLLLIEVAPAIITLLQRVNPAGPEASLELDRVIDSGRKQARRVDVNGVRSAIAQWPGIEWEPAFPVVRHCLGFNHPTSGRLLCPVTLDWGNNSVREALRRGTQEVTAADLPSFIWPEGAFDILDLYKGFLRSPLLITAYKHIFISPSSAREADRSTRGGNAALHDVSFVTYESIAYVTVVTRFALSNEPTFGAGGCSTDKRRRSGFPNRSFYRELLEHKELMSEAELISLLQWWNEKIYPRSIYTSGEVRDDSAGAIMREQARLKRLGGEAAEASRQAEAAMTSPEPSYPPTELNTPPP